MNVSVGMPSKTTTAKAGAKGATKLAQSRTVRRAAKPPAKATWFVGKKLAKRKAKKHARRYSEAAQRYGEAARMAWSAVLIYGPMAAEVLGVVEQPKPRRRVPAFLTGIGVGAGVGAGVAYLVSRKGTA